ncbi:MAG: hypothetical protein L0Z53_03405, partial [Acidobacteriales bacterium]|nr:hypothetical protein [Terriglobales bacterium]
FDDPSFMQVVVFGGVMKTMQMFEEADNLGRRIRWAFDGPQLLVVPRAGDWANAYYERESRSLQFFYFLMALANRSTPANRRISFHTKPHTPFWMISRPISITLQRPNRLLFMNRSLT